MRLSFNYETLKTMKYQITTNMIKNITTKEFLDKLNEGENFIVDLYADWCMPCKMLAPKLEEAANELKGNVSIYKFDIETDKDFAIDLGVRSIPTIKSFSGGQNVNTLIGGNISLDDINKLVNEIK